MSTVGHETVLCIEHFHSNEPQGLSDFCSFDRDNDVTARERKWDRYKHTKQIQMSELVCDRDNDVTARERRWDRYKHTKQIQMSELVCDRDSDVTARERKRAGLHANTQNISTGKYGSDNDNVSVRGVFGGG